MSGEYAILKDDWILRGWKDEAYALVRWRTSQVIKLDRDSFYVLDSCDGHTDFSSRAFLPGHRKIMAIFKGKGVIRACEYGEKLHSAQRYRRAVNTKIFAILWSITGKCNFCCRHCFMDAPDKKYGELTTEKLWKVLDQMEEANVVRVALTGGEPLVRKDFPELIRQLAVRHIGIVEIFTNASLLTDKILDVIEENGFHPIFKVSFDCVGSHDYMRGLKGAEEATIRGIKLLKDRGFPVIIITSIDKVVAQGLLKTLTLLKKLQVDGWWMAPPVKVGCWVNSDSAIPEEELISLLKQVLLEWNRLGRPMRIKLWRFGQFRSKEEGVAYIPPSVLYDDNTWNCFATHSMAYLMPDGKLIPCGSLTGTEFTENMPNIWEIPLKKAWDTEELSICCNLKKGMVRQKNRECQECEYFPLCGCGCRTMALLETGDYWHYDPVLCRLFKTGAMQQMWNLAASLEEAEAE